jgi:hypothetical protein
MEVEFKTAKLANEKGFELKTKKVWLSKDSMLEPISGTHPNELYSGYAEDCIIYPRPIQSLLQKWLRDVHNIHINVCPHGDYKLFLVEIYHPTETNISGYTPIEGVRGNTYEEALELGLQKGLELI